MFTTKNYPLYSIFITVAVAFGLFAVVGLTPILAEAESVDQAVVETVAQPETQAQEETNDDMVEDKDEQLPLTGGVESELALIGETEEGQKALGGEEDPATFEAEKVEVPPVASSTPMTNMTEETDSATSTSALENDQAILIPPMASSTSELETEGEDVPFVPPVASSTPGTPGGMTPPSADPFDPDADGGDNLGFEIVSLENSFTTAENLDDNETEIEVVSAENTFNTLSDSQEPALTEAVSGEYDFTTLALTEEAGEVVSLEHTFNTLSDSQEPALTEAVSGEFNFVTLPGDVEPPLLDEVVSMEHFFTTDGGGEEPPLEETVSLEYSFTTLSDGGEPPLDEVVSEEYTFRTDSIGQEVVSVEYSFVTDRDDGGEPPLDEVVSAEYAFTTTSGGGEPPIDEVVSDEYSFTTTDGGGGEPPLDEVVSTEYSFTTSGSGEPPLDEEISDEYSFTTSNGGGGGDDDDDNGGGGGGGGRRRVDRDEVLASACPVYLREFIRLGQANNPTEVLKLQWFLLNYEGFNVPLTGYYDLQTFEAVKSFQLRYAEDVLHTWGITDPTGYVYITTMLKINYLYCEIDDPIRLELQLPAGVMAGAGHVAWSGYGATGLGKGSGAELLIYPPLVREGQGFAPLDLDLPQAVETKSRNLIHLAAAGFSSIFSSDDWDFRAWLLVGLILLALVLVGLIGWLAYRLSQVRKERELLEESNNLINEAEAELGAFPLVGEGAETAPVQEETDEVISEYNQVNGNDAEAMVDGGQAAIPLGAASVDKKEAEEELETVIVPEKY